MPKKKKRRQPWHRAAWTPDWKYKREDAQLIIDLIGNESDLPRIEREVSTVCRQSNVSYLGLKDFRALWSTRVFMRRGTFAIPTGRGS